MELSKLDYWIAENRSKRVRAKGAIGTGGR